MKKLIEKSIFAIALLFGLMLTGGISVQADEIGDTGNTNQGNLSGTNVYTFYYIYDSANDAIELKVVTKKALIEFGNTNEHIFNSSDDRIELHTRAPVLGSSLDNAITDMNSIGGYNLSITDAKNELAALGYYDAGNGIWKCEGGYLTYVSAVKIRKKTHTVKYSANGGSGAPGSQTKTEGAILTLSSKKPTRTGYHFKHWECSAGGNYSPGGKYGRDQDGGSVTMKAYWVDDIAPSITSLSVTPASWSSGNGSVVIKTRDQGKGVDTIKLERYSEVSNKWETVATWSANGSTSEITKTYTEKSEGVFKYKVTVKDKADNSKSSTSSTIYLDHSNPVIAAFVNNMSWTKTAPTISASATDYLTGTRRRGSGVKKIVIKDSKGNTVASGTSSVSYKLESKYSGVVSWTIIATDNVGHSAQKTVTTKYDGIKPEISSIVAEPGSWSKDNGTVKITAIDRESGIDKVELRRVSLCNGSTTTVKTWTHNKIKTSVVDTYTENDEGKFSYIVTVYDAVGNGVTKTSSSIYLDHSNPMLYGLTGTETDWTNEAPVIDVEAKDYLYGTTIVGSGVESIVITDDTGKQVSKGTTRVKYTLEDKYEGIHNFKITVTDKVGHSVSRTVTTKYDKTSPHIEGTERDFVCNGKNISGYCQDNILDQNIDDNVARSENAPNHSSGIKSVILYGVKNGGKTTISEDTTRKVFAEPDETATFHLYYDCNLTEDKYEYYLVIVKDFAGNVTQKKLLSQKALLTWFRTSIEG